MELNFIAENPRVSVVDCLASVVAIIEANQGSSSQRSMSSILSNMQEKCAVVEVDTFEEDGGSDQNAAVCSLPTSISSHLATEVEESGSVEGSAAMAIVEDETSSQGYQELPTAEEESIQLPSVVPIGDDAQMDKDGTYTSIWSKKRTEMEKKAERQAQRRLHQYNREGKSVEEVIDEALKDYAEFHEMAHTVRLKFEEEKDKVLTLVKSLIDGRQKSVFNENLSEGKGSHLIWTWKLLHRNSVTPISGFEYFLGQTQGEEDEDRHPNKKARLDETLQSSYSIPIGLRGRPFVPHSKM